MSDDEIRALVNCFSDQYRGFARRLADEAIARGAEIARLRGTPTHEERLADLQAAHDDRETRLRERVTQLETALRGLRFGNLLCWCPCGPTELGQHDRACEIARAALPE